MFKVNAVKCKLLLCMAFKDEILSKNCRYFYLAFCLRGPDAWLKVHKVGPRAAVADCALLAVRRGISLTCRTANRAGSGAEWLFVVCEVQSALTLHAYG